MGTQWVACVKVSGWLANPARSGDSQRSTNLSTKRW